MKYLVTVCLVLITLYAPAQEISSELVSQMVDPCVVKIETLNAANQKIGVGSGVILTTEGYVITNYHVFNGGTSLRITNQALNRFYTSSQIVYSDAARDVLIFKISASNLKAIRLGNSDSLKKGQTVYAIGSPFDLDNTFTRGVISGFRQLSSNNSFKYLPFIQHDAAISPGNSGGALVNGKGELIGLNTLVSSEIKAQNINYAIPINDIKTILNYNRLSSIIDGKKAVAANKAGKEYPYIAPEKYENKKEKKYIPPPSQKPDNPYGAGNGLISIWTDCATCIMDIWIDKEYVGRTNSYFTTTPTCGQTGTISKVVGSGSSHLIEAKDVSNRRTWSTSITVNEGICYMQLLTSK